MLPSIQTKQLCTYDTAEPAHAFMGVTRRETPRVGYEPALARQTMVFFVVRFPVLSVRFPQKSVGLVGARNAGLRLRSSDLDIRAPSSPVASLSFCIILVPWPSPLKP